MGISRSLERKLSDLGEQYRKSGNPVHAWTAIGLAAELRLSVIPEWLLQYLGRAAKDILTLREQTESSTHEAEQVGRALGFVGSRGRASKREEVYRTSENARIVREVQEGIHNGDKRYLVFERVGKKFGRSRQQIAAIYVNSSPAPPPTTK